MPKNMTPVPDSIHIKISVFAAKNNLTKEKARNILLDCAVTESGDENQDFESDIKKRLGVPY